jgi:hypothetical protein
MTPSLSVPFLAVFKRAHADEYRAAANGGGQDTVRQMKLNVRRCVSGAACCARPQADFHNFACERRNPSVFPILGS